MPDPSGGRGAANDATVDDTPVREADLAAEADTAVEAAEAKVRKQSEHLDAAKEALAQAKAARKELG